MKVLSMGWVVQTWGIACMIVKGLLPSVDAAIFADTGYEPEGTYTFIKTHAPWLESHGISIITVQDNLADRAFSEWGGVFIPARTTRLDGTASGLLHRQCTQRWKIAPIRRWIQAHRKNTSCEMWLGISFDEISRMKDSGVGYIKNVYPLIELLPTPWTRGRVIDWLKSENIPIPPKSACTFCPYHSDKEWREIKKSPLDWKEAVEMDKAIRNARVGYLTYLHRKLIPLEGVLVESLEDMGQLSMFNEECEGVCGV